MRNEINSCMKYLFALFITLGLVSCGIWKKDTLAKIRLSIPITFCPRK